jgi:C4-type Zn-finger protein
MESSTLKEDFETEVQSGENELKGEPGLAALELTTIDHIMDQIHREVAELKQVPRTRQSERKAVQCRKWSQTETQDFLRVLSQIGPDFTCMELH